MMRRFARGYLAILLTGMMLLLAACDATGLPSGGSATPTTGATAPTATAEETDPTPTQPNVSEAPTNTPRTRPRSTPTVEAKVTAEPTETVAAGDGGDGGNAQENAVLRQIEEDTAQMRGLDPTANVKEEFITEDQLRENLTRDMETDYPKEDAQRDAAELWLMRLSDDPTLDLHQLYIDLQTEQVAGYYDPKKKELFVRSDGSELSPLSRQTLSHEYTHSLQDQHYDLQKLLPDDSTDDDRNLGIRALVEGDATLSGLLYARNYFTEEEFQQMITESEGSSTAMLDKAPRYIRDSLLFPYDKGVEFVIQLGAMLDFGRIDEALKDPPDSTEQILHPEKYINEPRDLPKPVSSPPLTDTLGAGWTKTDGGTIGEFDLQIILHENGASNYERAAAGWGGGLYDFYQNGDKSLLMLTTTWDTKKDADEYETALEQTFENATQDGNTWKVDDRYFSMKRVGDTISLGASTDSGALEKAMGEVK